MRGVLTIIFAGIRKRKLQTAVFAVCCGLCSFFLLGALVLNFALNDSFDMTYGKLNAPNVSISIEETKLAKEELEQFLNGLSYVESYNISKSYLASNVQLPNWEMKFAFLAASDTVHVERGSVVVNNVVYYAVAGEEVHISVNGHTVAFVIDSIITDPVNSAPKSMLPYFWINADELQELTQGYDKGNHLVMAVFDDVKDTGERFASDFEAYFGFAFDGSFLSYEDIRYSYLFGYEIFAEFFMVLCVFLFVITLIITVLFSRMAVYGDMSNIGILKTVGFTDGHIKRIYLLRYMVVAVISGAVGMGLAGGLIRTWFGGMFVRIDRSLFQIKNLWLYQLLALVTICLVLYVVVYFSIREIVKVSLIDAIHFRNGSKRRYMPNLFVTSPKLLQLNLAFLKCVQRKWESFFIVALTFGMALLYLTSFYIIDGVKKADVHLAEWGIVEMDIYVSRKTNVDEAESGLLGTLERDAAVDFYYAALSDNINYRIPGSSVTQNVMGDVYDKSIPDGLEFLFTEGRNPQNYEEAAVGINFAKENGVGIGDRIVVIRNGKETELEIVGIYPSFKQYGNSIRFLTKDIQEFFGHLANGYYSVVLKDGENVNAFAARMTEEYKDFDFFPMERSTTRSVEALVPPLAVAMLLFALIMFLIIWCMTKIMMIECKYEWKIYESIGFSWKRIKALMRWRFGLPLTVGAVIAIPLSIYAVPGWMNPLAQRLGLYKIPVYPNILLVVIALAGILCCGLVAIAIPLRKADKKRT